MASDIERFLYGDAAELVSPEGDVGDYFISEFLLSTEQLMLTISSSRTPYQFTRHEFSDLRLVEFNGIEDDEGILCLPWSIGAFHSWQEAPDQWKFSMKCNHCRWTWYSKWPVKREGDEGIIDQ